jgi:hypothetical protein
MNEMPLLPLFLIIQGSRPAKLEKADILEMTVQHVQRLHEEQKQQKQQEATPETENGASPKLQEIKQTQTSQESSISSNKSRVKPKFEYEEDQRRLPSTVPNCCRKHCEQAATTTQRSVTSCVQKGYHEGSLSPKFRAGFRECAREAREALNHFDDIDPAVCERLSSHLASRLDSLENRNDVSSSSSSHEAADSTQNTMPEDARVLASSVLIQTPTGLALMPTKLPNGDLAFIIPAYIKSSLISCLNSETAQHCRLNYELGESKHLQEGVVWRPW